MTTDKKQPYQSHAREDIYALTVRSAARNLVHDVSDAISSDKAEKIIRERNPELTLDFFVSVFESYRNLGAIVAAVCDPHSPLNSSPEAKNLVLEAIDYMYLGKKAEGALSLERDSWHAKRNQVIRDMRETLSQIDDNQT
jgi:hypothetical protein